MGRPDKGLHEKDHRAAADAHGHAACMYIIVHGTAALGASRLLHLAHAASNGAYPIQHHLR